MSQISPPVRILLIGAVVFLAAWFTILKPKPAEIAPLTTTTTPATPSTGAGKVVDKAKAAAGQKDESAAADTATAPATTSARDAKPEAPAAVAIPAEALAKLPKDVARALERRKVLVLGVFADGAKPWRPMSDDDRYVRNSLRKANRYDGDVFVKHVGISKLSTYGPLVNDLHVNQSPSIVVIDTNLKGKVLTGYVDRISINQVIADARDAGTEPDITNPFLRDLNAICGRYEVRMSRLSRPTIPGKRAELASMSRALAVGKAYHRGVARLHAPAKWRSLKADTVKFLAADVRTATAMQKAYKAGDKNAFWAAYGTLDRDGIKRMDRRYDEAGLTECVSNRRS